MKTDIDRQGMETDINRQDMKTDISRQSIKTDFDRLGMKIDINRQDITTDIDRQDMKTDISCQDTKTNINCRDVKASYPANPLVSGQILAIRTKNTYQPSGHKDRHLPVGTIEQTLTIRTPTKIRIQGHTLTVENEES